MKFSSYETNHPYSIHYYHVSIANLCYENYIIHEHDHFDSNF